MSVLYLYHVTVQYFPVLGPKKSVFFRIGRLGASALYHCFSTIKAVDRKKYPNEKTKKCKTFIGPYNKEYIWKSL